VGAHAVTVRVTDPEGLFAEASFAVRVLAAPVLAAIADQTVSEGNPVAVTATATDADTPAADLRYALVAGPAGVTIDPVTGAIGGVAAVGRHAVTVRVTDPDGLTSDRTFALRVTAPPRLAAVADVRLTEGTPLRVTPVATDADNDAADLTWRLVAGPEWISIDPATGIVTGDTTGKAGAPVRVEVEVTDPDGQAARTAFLVGVDPPPASGGGQFGMAAVGIAIPFMALIDSLSGGGPGQVQRPPAGRGDPACLAIADARLLPAAFREEGRIAELPVLLESAGGIRAAVMDVSFVTGSVEFLGAVLARGLPAGVRLATEVRTEGDRTVVRVTIRAPMGLPAGALELFWLRFRLGEAGLDAADLQIVTVAINGENRCGPEIPLAAAELPPEAPRAIRLAGAAVAEAAAIDLHLGAFAATAAVPPLVAGGDDAVLDLRVSGIGAASRLELALAWDADAFTPVLAGVAEGRTGALALDPDRPGEGVLRIDGLGELGAVAAALAQIALVAAVAGPSGRGQGRLVARGVTVDGVDLPLTHHVAGADDPDGAEDDLSGFDMAGLSGLAIPMAVPAGGAWASTTWAGE
jgi:hypothetical protein